MQVLCDALVTVLLLLRNHILAGQECRAQL